MVRAVARQFVTALDTSLKQGGNNQESWTAGFRSSALGRHLLENTTESNSPVNSAQGVYDAILTVAKRSELAKRSGGSATTVLTGTKEEVSAALGQAHGDAPSTPNEEMTEEKKIRAAMMEAAKTERNRFSGTLFGGGKT